VWAQTERSPRIQHMFDCMFNALCDEFFLPGLVANLEHGEKWPGGLGSCLELLAFALSWLNNFFVVDEDLRIPAAVGQLFEMMEEELPEEHPSVALVIKLKEDFPPLPPGDERNRGGVHLAVWRQCRPPAKAAAPDLTVGTRLQLFRSLGNEAFKKQRWGRAELCYDAAESEGGLGLDLVLSNRAAARLKLQNYSGAREDAASAVALDAKNAKAWFRLAEARVALADVTAREAADMAHSLAPSSATVALVKKAEAIVASPVEFGEMD
jgi:tetratricopeptide (TPR) repeat protein